MLLVQSPISLVVKVSLLRSVGPVLGTRTCLPSEARANILTSVARCFQKSSAHVVSPQSKKPLSEDSVTNSH